MNLVNRMLPILCICIGAAGYFYIMDESPVRFGSQSTPDEVNMWRVSAGFLLTVFGVVIGVAYRLLQDKRKRGRKYINSISKFLSELGRSIDLWIGLCGAPLVFALLLQSTQGATWPGLIAVALQNGFCCALIVDGLMTDHKN